MFLTSRSWRAWQFVLKDVTKMSLQLTLAARYLAGRKLRTFLTTLAVVFGVLVIFGMNIVLPTMMQALQANVMGASGEVDFSVTHTSGNPFPTETAARLDSVEGLRAVSPSLQRTVNLPADFVDGDPGRLDNINAVKLTGIDPERSRAVRAYPLVAGRYLEADDSASALISQTLADAFSVKVGDSISLPTSRGLEQLIIVGILPARTDPGNEEVIVTLAQAQAMTGEAGKINVLDVNISDSFAGEARRAEIQANIEAALGRDYKVGTLLSGSDMFAMLETGQAALSGFGMLALFMGAFIIFNTFRTVVAERRRDIGMLRALGATRRTIIGMILAEGLLQGILGTLGGLALGYLLGLATLRVAEGPLSAFINLKLGAPVVPPELVLFASLMGVGVTVFAGLVPAIQASRITPLEALRPSAAEADFNRRAGLGVWLGALLIALAVLAIFSGQLAFILPGGFIFLLGLVLVAPILVRPFALAFGRLSALVYARHGISDLAQGNLTRQPARVAITASSTMLGLAVIVAAGGLISSLGGNMYDMIRRSLGSDYLFVPPSVALWGDNLGADARFAGQLSALDGVEAVSTLRFAGTVADGQGISLMGIDPQAFPVVSGLEFQQNTFLTEAEAYTSLGGERAMIANGALMMSLGLKVGDSLELATPNGPATYQIVAVGAELLNAKINTGFVSQANLLADFGVDEDVFVQLNLTPNADRAALDAQIRAIAYDYPQFTLISGESYYQSLKAQMDTAFSALYFVFALLAFPSLIAMLNTLMVSVIERTREIGMIRAVGGTRKQVRQMVITEALILAAIGASFGILGGLYLGYVFVTALEAVFPLGYTFPLTGILAALAFGLLFGALAAILPSRHAAGLQVVEALRYE
jgi:putative ABC transport system permease protein